MKQGDVGTELVCTIVDENGAPLDLSAVDNVTLVMVIGSQRFERVCVVLDAPAGKVGYTIAPGDLSESGPVSMELIVRFLDGDTYHSSIITDKVEAAL